MEFQGSPPSPNSIFGVGDVSSSRPGSTQVVPAGEGFTKSATATSSEPSERAGSEGPPERMKQGYQLFAFLSILIRAPSHHKIM